MQTTTFTLTNRQRFHLVSAKFYLSNRSKARGTILNALYSTSEEALRLRVFQALAQMPAEAKDRETRIAMMHLVAVLATVGVIDDANTSWDRAVDLGWNPANVVEEIAPQER
jgi:hypothetical protein